MLDKFLKQRFNRMVFHSLHAGDDKTFIEKNKDNQCFLLKSLIKNAQFYVYVYCDDCHTLMDKGVFEILLNKTNAEVKIILNRMDEPSPNIAQKLSQLNGKVHFTDKMHDRHFYVSDYKRWALKKNHEFFYNFGSFEMARAMKSAFQRMWDTSDDFIAPHFIGSHPYNDKSAQQTKENLNGREI